MASFKWMTSNHKQGISCMLGDEMGLGKTAQSVAVLEHIRLCQMVQRPFLVRRHHTTASTKRSPTIVLPPPES